MGAFVLNVFSIFQDSAADFGEKENNGKRTLLLQMAQLVSILFLKKSTTSLGISLEPAVSPPCSLE